LLSVVTTNEKAIALYKSLGFITYGMEPKALKLQGQYWDEELMVLALN
jgi:RimJ/RimL family protein N-acetyltransferase